MTQDMTVCRQSDDSLSLNSQSKRTKSFEASELLPLNSFLCTERHYQQSRRGLSVQKWRAVQRQSIKSVVALHHLGQDSITDQWKSVK